MSKRFKDYIGTPFLDGLLPIIPVGAKLSPHSKIDPAKIGKIPGEICEDGKWIGFKGWQNHTLEPAVAHVFDRWSRGQPCATIGTQAQLLPGIDMDADDREVAAIVLTEALLALGNAPKRGRPNSEKYLLMYRLKEDAIPIRKKRLQFRRPGQEVMAIEVLGQGQHYLIDGMHPSGVEYEWDSHPLQFGHANLTEIDARMVDEFLQGVISALTKAGFELVKGGVGSRVRTSAARSGIGENHPDRCSDLDMLIDWMRACPCDDPEFETRDDWLQALCAIKAACGGSEEFFDDYVWPWCEAYEGNEYDYVKGVWDSIHDSALGWTYLVAVGQAFSWMPPNSFETIDADADGATGGEAPRAPLDPNEGVLGAEFVRRHARVDWTFTQHGTGGIFRYCRVGIWTEDNQTALHDVHALCRHVGNEVLNTPNPNQAMVRLSRSLCSSHTAQGVLRLVRADPLMQVPEEAFDARPWLAGVPGGYIDEYNVLRAPDPGLLITKCLGVRPDFTARCLRFDALLSRMCNGDPDMVEAILRAFGYALSGTGQEQLFWYFHGPGGSGKTTLLDIVAKIMGSYGAAIDHEIFMRGSSEKRFGTSLMAGRRFLYSSEIDEGQEWSETVLKTATGGGMMPIERKYQPGGLAPVRWALFFQGNHWPRFRKVDGALMRRYVPVHFQHALPEEQQQRNLAQELFEAEGPAIAACLFEARARYRDKGIFITKAMLQERNEYSISQDKMGLFLEERVVFEPNAVTPTTGVYNDWLSWLSETDGTGTSRKFGGSLHRFVRDLKQRPEIRSNEISFERRRVNGPNAVHVCVGMRIVCAAVSEETARLFE